MITIRFSCKSMCNSNAQFTLLVHYHFIAFIVSFQQIERIHRFGGGKKCTRLNVKSFAHHSHATCTLSIDNCQWKNKIRFTKGIKTSFE